MYTIERRRMRAAILAASGQPLVIDDVVLPENLDYGQVLVRVLYSGICGSQLGEIDAKKGEDHHLPHLLGHEASAEVLQCGPGVRHVAIGDLVVLHWRKGLGIESVPPVYSWRGQRLNAGWLTTFNEYAVISENRMTRVPAGTPTHLLPLLGCAVTTGLGVVNNDARVRLGESMLVFGVGGVGLSIVQGAAQAGAYPIIALDIHENRLKLARRVGATHTVNTVQCDARRKVAEILEEIGQSQGIDVCIDNTGRSSVIALCYELAHSRGRVVCVGVPIQGDATSIYTLPLHFGKSIQGSHGGEAVPHEDIPRYLRLLRAGRLDIETLITGMYHLHEINTAIRDMRSGAVAGRCLIKFC